MSPYHFNRLFRALFRETPHEYLTMIRLTEAQRLLRMTSMSLAEVSLAVGFQQASSFSRLFRHRFGLSPGEYRRADRFGRCLRTRSIFATSDKTAEPATQ